MSMILLLGAGLESVSSVSMCCVWPEVRDWLVCWLFDFFKKLIVDGLVDWSVLSHSYQSAASVGSSGWEAASSPVPGCRCTWQRCHQSICWRNHHSITKENHWCIMILLAIWNTKYFKPSKTWNENSLSRLLENGSLGQLFPLMVGEKRAEGGEPWIRF